MKRQGRAPNDRDAVRVHGVRGRRAWLRDAWLVVGGVMLGAVLTFGVRGRADDLRPPQSPEVLVALAQRLEVEHARVDLLVERGEFDRAIEALEQVRKGPWPDRVLGGDASILLKHDAYGRLLRLRLDHPDVDPRTSAELMTTLQEGLGRDWQELPDNAFTARLVALEGELFEQQGRDDEALTAYEHALAIDRRLLDQLLSGEQ